MSLPVQLTLTALSVALGTALQISGLGGPVANAVAWSAVAFLLAMLLLQHMRGEAGSALHGEVARRARRFGNDLIAFSRRRHASSPRDRRATWRSWLTGSQFRREYDADTMSLFRERFGEGLLQLVDDMRSVGLIGRASCRERVLCVV